VQFNELLTNVLNPVEKNVQSQMKKKK